MLLFVVQYWYCFCWHFMFSRSHEMWCHWQVPDRGGRAYELEPPPPEMPSFQNRQQQQPMQQRDRGGKWLVSQIAWSLIGALIMMMMVASYTYLLLSVSVWGTGDRYRSVRFQFNDFNSLSILFPWANLCSISTSYIVLSFSPYVNYFQSLTVLFFSVRVLVPVWQNF